MKESWELAEDFWRIEMNANELADAWQNKVDMWEGKHYENWCEEVSTMLRQQQAEIEALKVEIVSIEKNTDYWVDKNNWIRNNEPVELTQRDILSILQDANSVPCGQPIWNSTEEYNKLKAIIESAIRYTHLVKELTEILSTIKCIADDISGYKDYENTYSDGWIDACNTVYDEVFAILRKAQEK